MRGDGMLKVLLVDDEVWVINGLIRKVHWADYGMNVVGTAIDGIEALKLAKELDPQVIITDLRMPGADGLSLIKELHDLNNEILCVILTGYDDFEFTQKALRLGVFDYLLKPVTKEILEDLLFRICIKLKDHKSDSKEIKAIDPKVTTKHNNYMISKITEYIQDYYQQDLTLSSVAAKFEVNSSYLSAIFTQSMHETFCQYLARVRVDKAKQLLQYTKYSVNSIASRVGFSDYQHFVRTFKRVTGNTPTEFRNQHAEEAKH